MNFSLFIARRLSLSDGGRKSSPAIRVSVAAVALSVAVMIASVAIVLGFKREIREKILGFNSHISLFGVSSYEGDDNLLTLTPSLTSILDETPYVTDYSLEISIPAILKTTSDFKGIYLRSINGKSLREFAGGMLEEGVIPDYTKEGNENRIVLSSSAARKLGLKTGDKIDTYFISNDVRVRRLEIAGIYNSHFDSYDDIIAYGSMSLIQKLASISSTQGTSIQILTDDYSRIQDYTADLAARLNMALAEGRLYRNYRLDNALHQGAAYFHWLSMLDTNVVVILTLMAIVAIATLISGMLILILDKKRFIGIARALGATIGDVRQVFIHLAVKVALWGMLIGNAAMLLLLYCQDRWHFLPLDPEAYYIDFVPVELDWWWIGALNLGCLILIYASLLIPSRFVAGISPVAAMRTE